MRLWTLSLRRTSPPLFNVMSPVIVTTATPPTIRCSSCMRPLRLRTIPDLSLVPDHDQRDVIARRGFTTEPAHIGEQSVKQLLGRLAAMGVDRREQPLVGVLVTGLVERLAHTVA